MSCCSNNPLVARDLLATVVAAAWVFGCGSAPSPDPVAGGNTATPGPGAAAAPVSASDEPVALAFPDEQFRAQQPQPGVPRRFQLPAIQPFTLANGIQVYLVEQHTLPIVSFDLNFDGGDRTDPLGKAGLAGVCTELLAEGTEALDKLAFEAALADISAWVTSYAGGETHGVTMGTLRRHLDTALGLLADTLRRPGLRQAEFDRLRRQHLDRLKQRKGSPGGVATWLADTVLYGPQHPFGQVSSESSLQAVTLGDCKRYHARYIKPRGARLFVVGDITAAEIRERFAHHLRGWTGTMPKQRRLPAPAARPGKVFFVNVPEAAQSAVLVLNSGPQRTAADYPANRLMAAVLSGGFTSRFNMNLREDKGYSYGAGGRFRYTRDYGTFFAFTLVRSEATYQTVRELIGEISQLSSGARPVTEAELTREKDGIILGLPGNFATARQALRQYRQLVYFGLPLDYYNNHVDEIARVGLPQVMASARQHLRPQEVKFLIAGDASAPLIHHVDGKDEPLMRNGTQRPLLDGLRDLVTSDALGPGALVIMNADGQVVTGGS